MLNIFEEAKEYIKYKRFNKISEEMYDIGNHIVICKIKQGRNILSCSCQNHSRFCNENPICSHKIAFIILTFNEKLYKEIDKQIIQAEKYKNLKLPVSNLMLVEILEKINNSK